MRQLELFSLESWRYPRVKVEVADFFPQEVPVVLGQISRYYIARATRVVRRGFELWNDGLPDSPAVIARRFILAHRGHYPQSHVAEKIEAMSPPLHAIPTRHEHIVMVDLRRAYESILLRFGVREMKPLSYFSLYPLYFPPPSPGGGSEQARKLFYHCLPTVGRSGTTRVLTEEGVKLYKRQAIDPRPWGVVMTVLNALGWLAVRLGAVHVFVDSYAFPHEVPREFADFVRELGLELRLVAEGEGEIKGCGAYRVGEKISGHYSRVRGGKALIFDDEELGEWALGVAMRLSGRGLDKSMNID